MDEQVEWTGYGRWLSIVGGAVLLLSGIPLVFSSSNGAAAGWNIFLGLLLFGAIASGSKSAPKIALGVAILMLVRLILVPVLGGGVASFLLQLVQFGLIAAAAVDLRRQALSA
jgi:hypothetical protein